MVSSTGRYRVITSLLHPFFASSASTRRAHIGAILDAHGTRIIRFGIVGAVGVIVNTAVLYLLVRGGDVNHIVAAGISSEASILGNFVLNDRWTFADALPVDSRLSRCLRYNGVAFGGMTISLGVLFLLTSFAGFHYLVANFVAIGTAVFSNYVLNSRFTWRPGREPMELIPVPVLND